MNEDEIVEGERLGPPLATLEFWDRRLTFRRQAGPNDVWRVVSGPLGTFGLCSIEDTVLRQVQMRRTSRDGAGTSA